MPRFAIAHKVTKVVFLNTVGVADIAYLLFSCLEIKEGRSAFCHLFVIHHPVVSQPGHVDPFVARSTADVTDAARTLCHCRDK